MKTCTKCREAKGLECFGRRAVSKDGLNPRCKRCLATCYAAVADKVKAKSTAYYQANAERAKARGAAYRAANADKVKARGAAYRAANRGKAVVRATAWAAANAERANALKAAWAAANPEVRHKLDSIRRARKRTTQVERVGLRDVIARDGLHCYLCHRLTDPRAKPHATGKATLEHVVPLSRGGTHTMDNLKLACWPCNAMKGAHLTAEQAAARALARMLA